MNRFSAASIIRAVLKVVNADAITLGPISISARFVLTSFETLPAGYDEG